ncbi:hypothetical protein JW926_16975 [Candidatus Sumerlaeota bacterium]|nr:hypothetical protein [Candidatus Sumerlaeota bacterium]
MYYIRMFDNNNPNNKGAEEKGDKTKQGVKEKQKGLAFTEKDILNIKGKGESGLEAKDRAQGKKTCSPRYDASERSMEKREKEKERSAT